jgi:hypothetical protein
MAERTIDPARATATSRDWTTLGLGLAATILVGIGPILVLLAAVELSDPNAPGLIEAFYADRSRWQPMLIAEPAALLGLVVFLAFVGRLRAALGETVTTASLSAGAVVFAALGFASIAAQTTTAGTAIFAPAFEPDPHVAMALSHLGYVLLAGAMMGAATMAFAVARAVRRSPRLPRWLGPPSLGLGVLCLGSIFFVYAPLLLFLVWLPVLGVIASRPARGA